MPTLFDKAKTLIPGGVNSPVRAFSAVGGEPIFIDHAKGAYLFDKDSKRYIDFVSSWGPMIVGHAHPEVIHAVCEQAQKSLSYGMPTEREVEIAAEVNKLMPHMGKMRFVNSGTEATMTTIRLARGFTNRDKIIKFEGCYHGHSDCLLVKAGSGALTFGMPSSTGVPADTTKHTLTLSFNDCQQIKDTFAAQGDEIAAVILEPVSGNMNFVPATQTFINTLRECCDQHGTVLIFDEIMTGFRVSLKGASDIYQTTPDLTCLGKIIGGGMPVGAFGGRKDIMDKLSPVGPVYQAGTLSGNPIAMTAGLTTLKLIQAPGFYEKLADNTAYLVNGIKAAADAHHVPVTVNHIGSMFGLFFNEHDPLTDFQQVMAGNLERFTAFFHHMLDHGVHMAASAYEAGFLSAAHTQTDFDHTIDAAKQFFAQQ